LSDVNVSPGDALEADFLLSDHARVSAEIIDPTNGHVIARHDAGMLASGRQSIRFADADFAEDVAAGRYDMRIAANSSYEHGATATQTSEFQLASDRTAAVANRILLGAASPNPFNPSTEIEFSIPVGIAQSYRLAIYDGRGRLIRELASGSAGAGNYRVRWDGSDDRGQSVGSGIYLYRLTVGEAQLSDKMVLVK